MRRTLPGAAIEIDDSLPGAADTLLSALFLGGDLVLSQVCHISGLEAHMIQNWVARGHLPPPVNKHYSRRQLSRILIINMLRSVLPLDQICRLLSYVNGHLDDISDDAVDDSQLYLWLADLTRDFSPQALQAALDQYQEPFPGARRRVEQVLEILVTAYHASVLQHQAQQMISGLDTI